MRGTHNKLGEGERTVRLGQDSLPNIAETSGNWRKLAETSGNKRKLVESRYVVLPAPIIKSGKAY